MQLIFKSYLTDGKLLTKSIARSQHNNRRRKPNTQSTPKQSSFPVEIREPIGLTNDGSGIIYLRDCSRIYFCEWNLLGSLARRYEGEFPTSGEEIEFC